MKKLLSLLMCYVFLQAQSFALRGGPTSVGGEKVLGAYSGIMTELGGGTDVGLFLLAAVGNGASSGQIVMFSSSSSLAIGGPGPGPGISTGESDTYLGSLTGLSDASRGGSGKFTGIFNGTAATGNANYRSVSGQLTVTATKTGGDGSTQRLTGSASARTAAVNTVTNTTTVGTLKRFAVDGWLTSIDSVGSGFVVGG
jgi:hypothetical protein